MDVIVDANVLFAALIKRSTTAQLLFNSDLTLYSPEFVLEEFMKYSPLIQQKMKRTTEEFITILHQLHQIITIIPENEYKKQMKKAKRLSPDDKDLKIQEEVTIYNTQE